MRRGVLLLIMVALPLWGGSNQGILWDKTYGSDTTDIFYDITQGFQDEYLVSGGTEYPSGGSNFDFYILFIKEGGDTNWTRILGGASHEQAYAIAYDSVNNNIEPQAMAVGYTYSYGHGRCDLMAHLFNLEYDSINTAILGSTSYDVANDVAIDNEGDYVVVGYTSNDTTGGDFWIVRMDSMGDTIWTRTYGGDSTDALNGVVVDPKTGNYIVAGYTRSYGNSVQAWVARIDQETGDTFWTKTIGGTGVNIATDVVAFPDEPDIIVAGYTSSSGAGGYDVWLVKMDGLTGDTLWTETFGGGGTDEAEKIAYLPENRVVVAGYSNSYGLGNYDMFMLLVDRESGKALWYGTYGGSAEDRAYSVIVNRDTNIVLAGKTKSFGYGADDGYIVEVSPDSLRGLTLTGTSGEVFNSQNENRIYIYGAGFDQYSKGELALHFINSSGSEVYSVKADSIISNNEALFVLPQGILSPGYYDLYLDAGGIVYTDTLVKKIFIASLDAQYKWWQKDSILNLGDQVRNITEGDGDNDDTVELYATSYDNSLYRVYYDGTWHADKIYTGSQDARYVVVADGNNDGKNEVYLTLGDGSSHGYLIQLYFDGSAWQADTLYATDCNFNGVDVGDINNDGKNEVCVGNQKGKYFVFRYNQGVWNADSLALSYGRLFETRIGDVDRDGRLEAYVGAGQFNSLTGARIIKIYYSNDSLKSSVVVYRRYSHAYPTIDIGDIDGDGQCELYAGRYENPLLHSYGLYSYTYDGASWHERLCAVDNQDFRQIVVRDLDNDGHNDIYTGNDANHLIYRSSNFEKSAFINLDNSNVISIGYADFDNDGKLEIYAGTQNGNIYKITKVNYPSPQKSIEIYGLSLNTVNLHNEFRSCVFGRGLNNITSVKFVNENTGTEVYASQVYNNSYGETWVKVDSFQETGYYSLILNDGSSEDTLRDALLVNNPIPYYHEKRYFTITRLASNIKNAGPLISCDLDNDDSPEIYMAGDSLYRLRYTGDTFILEQLINIPGNVIQLDYAPWVDGQRVLYAASDDRNVYRITFVGGSYSCKRVTPMNYLDISGHYGATGVVAYDYTGNGLIDIISPQDNGTLDFIESNKEEDIKIVNHVRVFLGLGARATGAVFAHLWYPDHIAPLYVTGGNENSVAIKRLYYMSDTTAMYDVYSTSDHGGYVNLCGTNFLGGLIVSDHDTLKEIKYEGSAFNVVNLIAEDSGFTSVVDGDIDNDTRVEMWAANKNGWIYELEYEGYINYSPVDSFRLSNSAVRAITKADLDGDGLIEVYAVSGDGSLYRIEKKPKYEITISGVLPHIIDNSLPNARLIVYGSGFSRYEKEKIDVHLIKDGNEVLFTHPDSVVSDNKMLLSLNTQDMETGMYSLYINMDTVVSTDTLKGCVFINSVYTQKMWYSVQNVYHSNGARVTAMAPYTQHDPGLILSVAGLSDGTVVLPWLNDTIYKAGESIKDLIVDDFDRDGSNELYIATGNGQNTGYILRYMGQDRTDTLLAGSHDINTLAIGDVNEDGKKELVAGTENGILYIFTWQDSLFTVDSVGASSSEISSIQVGDVDNDGVLDIYAGICGSGSGSLLKLTPSSDTFIVSTILDNEPCYNKVFVGDIDNDGQEELYVASKSATIGTIEKITYNSGTWHADTIASSISPFNAIYAGDLNSDGMGEVYGAAHEFYGYALDTGKAITFTTMDKFTAFSPFVWTDGRLYIMAGTEGGDIFLIGEKEMSGPNAFDMYYTNVKVVPSGDTVVFGVFGRNMKVVTDGFLFSNSTGEVLPVVLKDKGENMVTLEATFSDSSPGYYNLVLTDGANADTLWGALLVHKKMSEVDTTKLYYNAQRIVNDADDEYTCSLVADLDRDGEFELYEGGDDLIRVRWNGVAYVKEEIKDIPGRVVSMSIGDLDNGTGRELYVTNDMGYVFKVYRVGAFWHMDTIYINNDSDVTGNCSVACDMYHTGFNELFMGIGGGSIDKYIVLENHGALNGRSDKNRDILIAKDGGDLSPEVCANETYFGSLPETGVIEKAVWTNMDEGLNDSGREGEIYVGVSDSQGAHVYRIAPLDKGYTTSPVVNFSYPDDRITLLKVALYGGTWWLSNNIFIADSATGNLYLLKFSGNHREKSKWRFIVDTLGHTDGFFTDVVSGDADNTGKLKIFASTSSGMIYTFVEDTTGVFHGKEIVDLKSPVWTLRTADLDGDGYVEIYATTRDGIYVIKSECDTTQPQTVHIVEPENNLWTNSDTVKIEWNHVSKVSGRGGEKEYTRPLNTLFRVNRERLIDRENKTKSPVFYRVEIASDSDFAVYTMDTTTTDTAIEFAPESDGIYFVRVRAEDSAGNAGDYSNIVAFGIDRVAPSVDSLTVLTDTPSVGPFEVSIFPHDSLSGVKGVKLYYRRGEDTAFASMDAVLVDGIYRGFIPEVQQAYDTVKFYVSVMDSAGNVANSPDGAPSVSYEFVAGATYISENGKIKEYAFIIPSLVKDVISFTLALPRKTRISLDVFDVDGRKVQTVYSGTLDRGIHRAKIRNLKKGVYLYVLKYDEKLKKGKIIVTGK